MPVEMLSYIFPALQRKLLARVSHYKLAACKQAGKCLESAILRESATVASKSLI